MKLSSDRNRLTGGYAGPRPAMGQAGLEQELEKAVHEVEAAIKLSDVKDAAARLRRAKAELALLDAESAGRPKRPRKD